MVIIRRKIPVIEKPSGEVYYIDSSFFIDFEERELVNYDVDKNIWYFYEKDKKYLQHKLLKKND